MLRLTINFHLQASTDGFNDKDAAEQLQTLVDFNTSSTTLPVLQSVEYKVLHESEERVSNQFPV